VAQQKVRVKVCCTPGRDAFNEEERAARDQPTAEMKTRVIKIIGPPAEVTSSILRNILLMYNSFNSRSH
jgi:hypothetical protein